MARLTKEEKEMLHSVEKGEWRSVKDLEKQKKHYQQLARQALLKNRRINIRLSNQDLEGLQAKAAQEGLPYQTLVASVLHKYVVGRLVEA